MGKSTQLIAIASLVLWAAGCDNTDASAIATDRSGVNAEENARTEIAAPPATDFGGARGDESEAARPSGCGENCNCGGHDEVADQAGCGEECNCGDHGRRSNCPYLQALEAEGRAPDDANEPQCPYAAMHPEAESPQAECPFHQKGPAQAE